MCGGSDLKMDGIDVTIHLGYRYNEICIGDAVYQMCADDVIEGSRSSASNALMQFTKAQLVDIVLGFVENGYEA